MQTKWPFTPTMYIPLYLSMYITHGITAIFINIPKSLVCTYLLLTYLIHTSYIFTTGWWTDSHYYLSVEVTKKAGTV